ncbi:MAG TPA: DUF411 domain-containing protein [Steroidobacter sp.]|jgi:hypothetical protein|nr:DUF411 domain-containing protein [Steroidobacteraceae bacterium]HLS80066.1 DUF411 domain-containing protein [Steroidobacter sp.]
MKSAYPLLLIASFLMLGACREDDELSASSAARAAPVKDVAATTGQPQVTVYKTESCGCCNVWIEHMQSHGFPVKAHNVDDMGPVKERLGVPYGKGSCHTAEVAGYFIEGHVPAADVQRLLAEKPDAKGLTVPGMPSGSPGMEQGDRVDPYQVLLVHNDGGVSVYSQYPK